MLGWHGICLLPGRLGLGLGPSGYGIDGILLRNWNSKGVSDSKGVQVWPRLVGRAIWPLQ